MSYVGHNGSPNASSCCDRGCGYFGIRLVLTPRSRLIGLELDCNMVRRPSNQNDTSMRRIVIVVDVTACASNDINSMLKRESAMYPMIKEPGHTPWRWKDSKRR